ncbi:MAG TPA: DUF4276 family protein [Archangium sp.]|uniref:DUF4276 family protein n=1 Tax=Archangium sp. TaxID=1872627 RepID=UPI002ED884F3
MSREHSRKRRSEIQPTIGLIVEGDAEFAAFPLLHKKKLVAGCPPLKPINLGGVGADNKPAGVAKLLAPKVIQHQVAGRTQVVICIDREHRALCAPGFASAVTEALRVELQRRGKPSTDVHVVIADRAFEAWLLADAKGLHQRKVFKRAPHFHSFEGQLGERQLKGEVELTTLLGRPYAKTKDGPDIFTKLDFTTARTHAKGASGSKSLDKFLRTLGV